MERDNFIRQGRNNASSGDRILPNDLSDQSRYETYLSQGMGNQNRQGQQVAENQNVMARPGSQPQLEGPRPFPQVIQNYNISNFNQYNTFQNTGSQRGGFGLSNPEPNYVLSER